MNTDQTPPVVNTPVKEGENTGFLKLDLPVRKVLFVLIASLCLWPFVTAPIALLLGLLIANLIGNPFGKKTGKVTKTLLQISVVGLGFGMNVQSAVKAGSQGILFTICSITGTLLLGYFLGKMMKIDSKTSHLISAGTAICGGSAIAAVSPIIHAEERQISVALGIVFILNSVALLIFPNVGHWLQMTQEQFGMWCAIAIHDTSSVVGAASAYGPTALGIATTVKLARALWIIPVAIGTSMAFKTKGKINIPYFIGYFIIAMLLNTYFKPVQEIAPTLVKIAKVGLTLTLFLIGASLSFKMLKSVGIRPLLQGVILWLCISLVSLWVVLHVV